MRPSVVSRNVAALAVATLTLGSAAVCNAQTGPALAARRELLDRATAASAEGRHDVAVENATRAGQILMTLSVRVFLATEYESLGDFASAHRSAAQCVNEAQRDATTANRDAIRARCQEIVASLRGRVGSVVPEAPSPEPAGLVVEIDGRPVASALLGLPYMVNAGQVTVTARADGYAPFSRTYTVQPTQEVRVPLALERAVGAGGASGAVAAPVVDDSGLFNASAPRRRNRGQRAPARENAGGVPSGAVVLMVTGGIFEVTALVFGVMYWTIDRADGCVEEPRRSGNLVCESEEIADRVRPMGTWAALGWGSFGVGLAAAGAGVLWSVLGRGAPTPRPETEVDVTAGEGAAGIRVRRHF